MKNKKRYINKRKGKMQRDYIVIIFMILIGLFFIVFGLEEEYNIKPIYSYTAQKNSYYEVLLKPNNFYEKSLLPSGSYYASKSIDFYKIMFKYDFVGNQKTDLIYDYNITASLVGKVRTDDNEEKEIWTRDFNLFEKNNNQVYDNKFSINEEVSVDYEYYNNLARSYEDTYGISIDSVLKVRLNIYNKTNILNSNSNQEKNEDFIELDIPLTNTITQVKENYEKNILKNIFSKDEKNINYRIIYYIIGGLFIFGSIQIMILKIKNNHKTPEEKYIRNMKHILKNYGDLIVTVTNKPNYKNLEIMNIEFLNDLINVAEQNQSNIILYESNESEESNLYVFAGGYVYIYIVTSNELK